jgi:two-component system chemotaxis response regulator CheY
MDVKVLVAGSSANIRKNITQSLQEIGVRNVVEAADGDQAIKGLRKDNFDIVFAEFNTQAGGKNIVEAIRKIDEELPIIVTAPQSQKLAEIKKTCPSASNYLTTPCTRQQLEKSVANFIPSLAS